MITYRVTLARDYAHYATVEVDAESEQEAEELACGLANNQVFEMGDDHDGTYVIESEIIEDIP